MDHDTIEYYRRALAGNDIRRWHVIQAVIASLNARTYLEIGVADGQSILQVDAPVKIGVDPIAPSGSVHGAVASGTMTYFQMTSDEFFSSPPSTIRTSGIDVAFIDGLHTYRQSLRDVENCLEYLNPSGVILVHDCNPPSETAATPAESWDDAAKMNLPGWSGIWTGDVWKTIVHLRSCRSDLNVGVADCDFGVGVVCRGGQKDLLPYSSRDIQFLSYADLVQHRLAFLGLFRPSELIGRFAGPQQDIITKAEALTRVARNYDRPSVSRTILMPNDITTPSISVIVPVYNGQATLERAIRSVLAQTFADWELLAVDDCSTDDSAAILARLSSADSRIRLLHTLENSGQCAARNLGVSHAQGEMICYLDQDDEYFPDYFATISQYREMGEVLMFNYDLVYDDSPETQVATWEPGRHKELMFVQLVSTPLDRKSVV